MNDEAPTKIPESHRHCPVGHATALLGDRWSMLIVREALRGVERYQDFKDGLSISDNTLTRRLSHLRQIGILERDESTRAHYRLTEAGRDLARPLAVLGDWAMKWLPVELPLKQPPDAVLDVADDIGLNARERLAKLAESSPHPLTSPKETS